MARTSQTETAVLGALAVMPMTGYALRESIRDVLGHFWSESFGQIYPTLSRLEHEGLVERRDSHRSTPSTITAAGLTRLRALLSTPVQDSPPRNGLMLRLFFGRHLGPDACRRLVLDAREGAERQLAGFAAIRTEMAADTETDADQPYWLLTISAGEHAARATIVWADEALASLDRLGSGA
jgi:DNA-binding PadR family transcriptional regulator